MQPVALYYSEQCGVDRHTHPIAGTCRLLRHPTQCTVYACALVSPSEFATADAFVARVEADVRRGYEAIARTYSVR